MPLVTGFLAAVAIASVHIAGPLLKRLDAVPRSRWLSAAGGISIAYVFVHLLPELAEVQTAVSRAEALPWLEHHAYLLGLVGLVTFYVLERAARSSAGPRGDRRGSDPVGWLHLASYTAFNAIIGYLVAVRAGTDTEALWPFAFAMGLHFVVNDHSLRRDHGRLYDRVGRWIVAAGVLAGWGLAQTVEIGEAAIGLPLAFLAGGVVLNVLKEELPEERESRLTPFVGAAAVYALLLMLG